MPVPVAGVSIPSVLQVVISPCQVFPAHGPGPGLRGRSALCACCSCQVECNPVLCHLSSQEWVSDHAPFPKLFVLPTGPSLLTGAMLSGLHSC